MTYFSVINFNLHHTSDFCREIAYARRDVALWPINGALAFVGICVFPALVGKKIALFNGRPDNNWPVSSTLSGSTLCGKTSIAPFPLIIVLILPDRLGDGAFLYITFLESWI